MSRTFVENDTNTSCFEDNISTLQVITRASENENIFSFPSIKIEQKPLDNQHRTYNYTIKNEQDYNNITEDNSKRETFRTSV